MRIIRDGTPFPQEFWQERDLTCPHCGCVFVLAPGDSPHVVVRSSGDPTSDWLGDVIARCPHCNRKHEHILVRQP